MVGYTGICGRCFVALNHGEILVASTEEGSLLCEGECVGTVVELYYVKLEDEEVCGQRDETFSLTVYKNVGFYIFYRMISIFRLRSSFSSH